MKYDLPWPKFFNHVYIDKVKQIFWLRRLGCDTWLKTMNCTNIYSTNVPTSSLIALKCLFYPSSPKDGQFRTPETIGKFIYHRQTMKHQQEANRLTWLFIEMKNWLDWQLCIQVTFRREKNFKTQCNKISFVIQLIIVIFSFLINFI